MSSWAMAFLTMGEDRHGYNDSISSGLAAHRGERWGGRGQVTGGKGKLAAFGWPVEDEGELAQPP